jgi:hypothetical protein
MRRLVALDIALAFAVAARRRKSWPCERWSRSVGFAMLFLARTLLLAATIAMH